MNARRHFSDWSYVLHVASTLTAEDLFLPSIQFPLSVEARERNSS